MGADKDGSPLGEPPCQGGGAQRAEKENLRNKVGLSRSDCRGKKKARPTVILLGLMLKRGSVSTRPQVGKAVETRRERVPYLFKLEKNRERGEV